jgi:hypothetical protein
MFQTFKLSTLEISFDLTRQTMKRFTTIPILILTLCATALSQTPPKPDVGTFELTPVAPPTPALKYQLLFDDALDRRPGNAAILYFDSILLMGPDARDKAAKALEAYDSRDMPRFDSLADSLNNPSLFTELDLAGRREFCDWQPPISEEGSGTLLPHLGPLRDIGRILKAKALREIGQGKINDALKTVRLGYELSDNVATEPVLISALISLRITTMVNDCLRTMMNRPDSPNLYWALANFPSRKPILRQSLRGEGTHWLAASGVDLVKLKAGEDLSVDQWHDLFAYAVRAVLNESNNSTHARLPDPVRDAGPELMLQSQAQYAELHHLTSEVSAKVDPIVLIGELYFRQYDIACDNMQKIGVLPYPALLAKSVEFSAYLTKLVQEEPKNPFLQTLPTIHAGVWTLASVDRQLAAMTAVEAIRSYASANGGKLPARLEDISDTPVPDNPVNGLPFDYGVNGEEATLSDSQSEATLTYTIKICK